MENRRDILKENIIMEVCVDSLESAIAAEKGGADRIELCQNLMAGGTTPSLGLIELVKEYIGIDISVMIRPRSGDFCYSNCEMEVMKKDIEVVRKIGIDGIVTGILTYNGEIDVNRMRKLIEIAKPIPITFHRAFDMVKDPFKALDKLVGLGVKRILTSGQENSAVDGIDLISQLVKRANSEIIIMAGGGINSGNVASIIKNTGVNEIHLSGKKRVSSKMEHRNTKVKMGGNIVIPEYDNYFTSEEIVGHIKKMLTRLN